MVKLAAGEHGLLTGKGRFTAACTKSCMCQNCNLYEAETVDHILYRCTHPNLMAVRESHDRKLRDCMLSTMYEDMMMMTGDQRVKLLLSGLGGGYIREWQNIYVRIAELVTTLYKATMNLKNPCT